MKRMLIFLLAVALCCGFLGYSYAAISATAEDMTFSETVRFGDPSVLDGRRVQFAYVYGNHMLWEVDYRFGPEDSYEVDYSFSQDYLQDGVQSEREALTVYSHAGVGMSMSGGEGFQPSYSGYGQMLRAVAARTPNGEEFEMNLKLKDYVDYHEYNFDLDYQSDRYVCHEHVDLMTMLDGEHTYEDSPSYEALSSLFRFPVTDSQVVSIKVQKGPDGQIWGIYFNAEDDTFISVHSAATDDGIYCIPVYRSSPDSDEILPGEYTLGMGLYFIPWKPYDDGYTYSGGLQRVTLDGAQAKNILPLPEDTAVCGLKLDGEAGAVWVLTLEDDTYILNRMSLDGSKHDRLELMTLKGNRPAGTPVWYRRNGLTLICVDQQISLVTESEDPKVEFTVPMGEAAEFFHHFEQATGGMFYADGMLYLMDHSQHDKFLNVTVYDRTGLRYWAEYRSNLVELNPYPSPSARYDEPVRIE